MPSSAIPSDPHSRRLVFDTEAWRERLEQLAEMRRRASASALIRQDDNAGSGGTAEAESDGRAKALPKLSAE